MDQTSFSELKGLYFKDLKSVSFVIIKRVVVTNRFLDDLLLLSESNSNIILFKEHLDRNNCIKEL